MIRRTLAFHAAPLSTLLAVVLTPHSAPAQVASVLDLQPLAVTTQAKGKPVKLIDLNPTIGRWYLLQTETAGKTVTVNLETTEGVTLALDPDAVQLVTTLAGQTKTCPIEGLETANAAAAPYTPACGGLVWVRRSAHGARTVTEAATDILRKGGPVGEALINFYKNNFNDTSEKADYSQAAAVSGGQADGAPPNAVLNKIFQGRTMATGGLAIPVEGGAADRLRIGAWYPAKGMPGIFAGVITPDAAAGAYTPTGGSSVDLVAFDMTKFSVHYAVGTDHPSVGWSDRAPMPHPGGGPDGFGDVAPLVRTGTVPPWDRSMVAGVISGGFKREHAAFKTGPLIGLHYGFSEDGVVLSRLQPGIMTVFAGLDGQPVMRTWTQEDARQGLNKLRFARQVGYPLIEDGKVGEHVDDPNGNWSGSNEGHLLTMRSGLCVVPTPGGRNFLVYAVFTGATPPHMAQVFKALGCSGAVHLDANSPTLTYAAVFHHAADGTLIGEHLHKDMAAADPKGSLKFVDQPDNRDFFYLIRRSGN